MGAVCFGRWPNGDLTGDHAMDRSLDYAEAFGKRELFISRRSWLGDKQCNNQGGSGKNG